MLTLERYLGEPDVTARLYAAARRERARAIGALVASLFKGKSTERRHAARAHLARQG